MPDEDEPETGRKGERDEAGVDVSLIRWMLSLTPAERLRFLEQRMEGIERVRALNGQ